MENHGTCPRCGATIVGKVTGPETALEDEIERLNAMLAWIDNINPQLVDAARERFGVVENSNLMRCNPETAMCHHEDYEVDWPTIEQIECAAQAIYCNLFHRQTAHTWRAENQIFRNAYMRAARAALIAVNRMHTRMGRQQIEARIAEINERIAATTQWGALLTALSEERRGLTRALLDFDNRPRTLPDKGD